MDGLSYFLVLIAAVVFLVFIFSKKIAASSDWRATVTPLASIMGSGFLVSAPLLAGTVGNYAVLCMMALLLLAYWVGSAIRFNIQYFEPVAQQQGIAQKVGLIARLALTVAYLISVSYYLKLLAAFILSNLGIESDVIANIITTAVLAIIAFVGIVKGLTVLEKVERYAVSLNLSVIAALIVALIYANIHLSLTTGWQLQPLWPEIGGEQGRILLGLLIVVQGFETSRYIGDEHPPEQRIKTMRWAQLISSCIYIVFLSLATILFEADTHSGVTGIITMIAPVAFVLPMLISVAAIGSQFSAAVADNSGAGGLIEELLNRKIKLPQAYAFIFIATLALTWLTDVNEIIAYASRAFAFYYFLQCIVALLMNKQQAGLWHWRSASFIIVAILCLLVFLLGVPAE